MIEELKRGEAFETGTLPTLWAPSANKKMAGIRRAPEPSAKEAVNVDNDQTGEAIRACLL